jgi:uncharacterized protein (TIGR00730 family)
MSRSLKNRICRISVLGSGKVCEKNPVYQQAVRLGQALAQEGFSVCHGGYGGVMEAVAKGCRLSGGQNTGITIRGASKKINPQSDTEIRMPSWKKRLFKLIEMGDAYVFLDGAIGTLAELFVVLEMTNRGLLSKPIIILGKRLHKLMRFLKKDISVKIPQNSYLTPSIAQAVKILIGYKG